MVLSSASYNASAAFDIFIDAYDYWGLPWIPWAAFNNGTFVDYLTLARDAVKNIDPTVIRGSNDTVVATVKLRTRTTAGGPSYRPVSVGTTGMVVDGPTVATIGTNTYRYVWWKIRWDDGRADGWSVEDYMQRAGTATHAHSLSVPYIHQCWDTPNTFDGRWACNASSAVMVLGYYQILDSWPCECSQPYPHTSDYGNYISQVYTYKGHTFDEMSEDPSGNPAHGAYGYIYHPGSIKENIRDYFILHGLDSWIDYTPTESEIKAEVDGGYPVVALTWLSEEGHYVVIRGYTDSGLYVVNDPYGRWPYGGGICGNYDGADVLYSWSEMRVGERKVVLAHGTVAQPDGTPPTISDFSVEPSSVTVGDPFTISYTVSDGGGSGLNRVELWRANIDGTVDDPSWAQIGSAITLSGDGPSTGSFPPDEPPAVGNYWYGIHVFDNESNYMDERIAGRGPIMVTVTSPPSVDRIEISGSTQVNEGSGAQYTCTAYYSDGSTANVTNSASWSDNSAYASISSSGYLTTSSVTSDQPCTVTATYSGYSDTHDVTVKNVPSSLDRIEISGSTQVNESSGAQYTCTAYYSDASTANVTGSASWSDNSPYASISSSGYLTTSSVTADQLCTITATYSGYSDTHVVTINNVPPDEFWKSPTATGKIDNDWKNPENAYGSDDQYAIAEGKFKEQDYYNFNFGLPANVTINGIEVRIEGHGETTASDYIMCDIYSASNGSWCASGLMTLGDGSDATATYGGASTTWGVSWQASDFADADFLLRIKTFSNPDRLSVDHVKVRVYYTAQVFYSLTTSVTGGHGTISSGGSHPAGSVVYLAATPDAGYRVKSWSGTDDDTSTANTNAVTMTSDKTVTVDFVAAIPMIAEIWIVTEYELTDGVPVDSHLWDFDMEVMIEEPGMLARIDLVKPGDPEPSGTFVEGEPGIWVFDPPDYTSLAGLQADYPQGMYTLEFRDGAGGLLRAVTLDYTVSAPAAAVDFTYPSEEGQTGVSTHPTLTWTVAPDAGDGLAAGVDDLATGDTIYFLDPSAVMATAWTPGPLLPNHMYDLNVDVLNVKDWTGSDWPTMTVNGDEFYYALVFTYFNEISFTTGEHALLPVYRFWSGRLGHHFYTISESEKNKLLDNYSHVWTYEGPVYYALSGDGDPSASPVYRFWSDRYNGHFYTVSESEKNKLISSYSHVWTHEGAKFYAYAEGQQPGGTSPVYRFWSDALNGHFYTISESEKTKLVTQYADVWSYEGIAWYAYK